MEFPRTSFYEGQLQLPVYGKPLLYDIREEDEEYLTDCDELPEELFDPLDSLIDSTFSSKNDDTDSSFVTPLISEPVTPASTEKDVFGRDTPKNRSSWKIRPENYGKVYNLMSGAPVDCKPFPTDSMISSSQVSYLEQLYENREENYFEGILVATKCDGYYKRGNYFKIPQDCMYRFSNQEQLDCLTTFDVQSTICAALNSKVQLLWLIGADSNGKIIGCNMPYEERDCLRQGLDYSLSTEFVPVVNPELVDIKFHQVDAGYTHDLYLVEISINTSVSTLYQLSSGRIFYNNHGTPTKLSGINEARLMLLDRKNAEHSEIIKKGGNIKQTLVPTSKSSTTQNFLYFTLAFSTGALFSYAICKRLT